MLDWLPKGPGQGRDLAPSKKTAEGYAAHASGDWLRAATLLHPLAAQYPEDAQVHYRLGDALYQIDRTQEALAPLERAVRLAGGVAAHHYKLGNALYDLERLEDALACYRRAIEIEPRHAQSLTNTGVILEIQDRTGEALDYYRRAIEANVTLLPAYGNLAVLLHRLERHAEAEEVYRQLLKLQPDAGFWRDLGIACQGLQRFDDAVRCYQHALAIDPDSAEACYRLGIALLNLEKYPEAEAAARHAVELAPGRVEGWVNLGDVLQAQRRMDEALAAYQRGIEINDAIPELLNNIGTAHKSKRSLEIACHYFERSIEIAPQFLPGLLNLANTRLTLGLNAEAIDGFRRMLEIEPRNEPAARQLLMARLYEPCDARELFEEHLAFARRFAIGTGSAPARKPGSRSGRALRVGYVSSDLRNHPVGYNVAPLIRFHDRSAIEVYLYADVKRADEMTAWFRKQAAWRSIAYLSDRAAADLIRQDEIDILVLLAGRFDDNRPLLASWRPAPIQVSMHDPATSGLAEVDYLIADRALVPRHGAEQFTERVVCLPTFFLHPTLEEAPRHEGPPVIENGWITFGSFNNPAKLNEGVVALWADVLRSVPGSRLLLKYMNHFSMPSVRSRYAGLFRKQGIEEDRLIFPGENAEERIQHLARYGQIDIALDPFPFTGSTTTFEALWMGVPVVTLEGDRMVSRWSAAMLRKAGLSWLIARTAAKYVEVARDLAANRDELIRLRGDLRDRVARSPLCAVQKRARQLERLYRRMWTRYTSLGTGP